MNGWINEKRSNPAKGRWRVTLDLGKKPSGGRLQKWITFRGTKGEAKKHLRNLLTAADKGELVVPSKRTLGEWLAEWLEKSVKVKHGSRTYETYRNAIQKHILPTELAAKPLQQVTPTDIEAYHHGLAGKLSHATLRLHHTILSSALKLAVRDGLLHRNVAPLATERPGRRPEQRKLRAWTAEEASKVLAMAKQTAKESGTAQTAALIAVALDSGARKGEFQALRWTDVDLTTGALQIERQLLKGGLKPVFGPTKTRELRRLDLSEETLTLLREHKREQAELKLANRPHYAEHDLIFAQRWEHKGGRGEWQLGGPLTPSTITTTLRRFVKLAGVRSINVHGLRHTSATLLLAAGVQPHVVQKRLGHSNITTTLNLYAHVLPSQQADAARRLAALLYS